MEEQGDKSNNSSNANSSSGKNQKKKQAKREEKEREEQSEMEEVEKELKKQKQKPKVTKPTITYFNTSGRADLLRLIFEVAGVDYEYEALNVPFYPSKGKDWFAYKQENGSHLLFGQVPRYQDPNGVDLVQSNAIARYLAHKYGLAGSTPEEAAMVDVVNEGINDFSNIYSKFIISTTRRPEVDHQETTEFVSENLPLWFDRFLKILRKNGNTGFFVGNKLSYADLHFLVILKRIEKVPGGIDAIEATPKIKAFRDRIASIPQVKAFYDSDPYGEQDTEQKT